jgi:hypothetical protein
MRSGSRRYNRSNHAGPSASGAELPRQFPARWVGIYRNHTRAAGMAQRLDRQQADHPAAHHHCRVPRTHRSKAHRMHRYGHGFDHGGMLEAEIVRKPVQNTARDHHVFGESAVAAVPAGRDPQHLPVLA